ncbi:Ciliogenesis-associated TTC17-interacting protein [Oryzias melastigma]|uniref:Ciliogenesis-associated TTC17-interacting protein n=1 Tax=Oryzias melastigma TaxID=30732 RepID=A0A834BY35_ORYME|nr:Ciliogenesis-associated TTC17-interacting protein [Oryzias melastigma]
MTTRHAAGACLFPLSKTEKEPKKKNIKLVPKIKNIEIFENRPFYQQLKSCFERIWMEAEEDKTVCLGDSETTDGPEHGQLAASDDAVAFMSSFDPEELQRCVFTESLVVFSESGRELGTFNVTVQHARKLQQPCLLLHAQSHGTIDGAPCGTTVTTYISCELEVLEENYHEYIKLEGHSVDNRCHLVQQDGKMFINEVTTVEEEVKKESASYPISSLNGLITEGSSLLLMRLITLRRRVPENMAFVTLDKQLNIIHTTFSDLGVKQMEVGGEVKEVFGVQRMVHSGKSSPDTWENYFLTNGHLVIRHQVGSPFTMRLLQLQSRTEGPGKVSLVQVENTADFLERRKELKEEYALYLRQHPEIRALISDFMQLLLLRKPENVYQFAKEYFSLK